MHLSDEEISQLKTLHSFLEKTFKGTSFGGYQMDDALRVLDKVYTQVEIDKERQKL